jgi:hypothetical protein
MKRKVEKRFQVYENGPAIKRKQQEKLGGKAGLRKIYYV